MAPIGVHAQHHLNKELLLAPESGRSGRWQWVMSGLFGTRQKSKPRVTLAQYCSASMIVSTRVVTAGSDGSG
jgi:hypothetical protein